MPRPGPSYIADGNIPPMVFVKNTSTSADNRVLVAGAGDRIAGVSQQAQRFAPWGPLQDGFAAVQGEQLRVFTEGEVCLLVLGGTVAAGDRLKSGALGVGVVATADGDEYGARALEAGTIGQQIRVEVVTGMRGA